MANRANMNKKQRTVMWIMAVLLVIAAFAARMGNTEYLSCLGYIYIPIVAIGVLLIYLLRDRK